MSGSGTDHSKLSSVKYLDSGRDLDWVSNIIKDFLDFLGHNMKLIFFSHIECWVSKLGKNGAWSSFLKDFFLENIQNEDFGFAIFENGLCRA